MNPARLDELERGLNGVAKRVLSAVPVQESWSALEIFSELRRVGSHMERRMVDGCLGKMVRDGIVKEPSPGHFMRTPRRQPPKPTKEPAPMAQAAVPKQPADVLDKLATMSSSLRAIAGQISLLATSMDDLALDIEADRNRAQAETTKFRQLQALLRDG